MHFRASIAKVHLHLHIKNYGWRQNEKKNNVEMIPIYTKW